MTKRRSASTRSHRSVYKACDLGELINALPAMFGFPPENSLVTLGMAGSRIVFGMRLDLADVAEDVDRAAALAVAHLEHQGVEGAITLSIGEPLLLGRRLVMAIETRLIRVRAVAGGWATDDRYWVSMAGGRPGGYPYRRTLDHPAAAQAVWEGQEIAPSRHSVEVSMAPVEGKRRAEIEEAAGLALENWAKPPLLDLNTAEGTATAMTQHVGPVIGDLTANEPVTDERLLLMGFLVTRTSIRDEAWGLITDASARDFVRVWLHVARNVPHDWAPASYCLAAFSAWMCGDGAKAVMAAEQALHLDPEYSMAGLMVELATSGLSPRQWVRAPR